MDFFAMVGGHGAAVFRMELEQALQAELGDVFSAYADTLLSPDLEVVPFERENFQPDDSEVLEIAPFDLPALLFDPLQNPVGWPTLDQSDETLSQVYCVFASDAANDRLIFQVIPRQQRLTRSSWQIFLHNDVFTRQEAPGLVLGGGCHAVYYTNALRFRSMHWLKQIIDITQYYRAATEADVDRFAALDSVHVEDLDDLKRSSGQWIRTRLAYILDSGVLNGVNVVALAGKALTFDVVLNIVGDGDEAKLVIPSDRRALRAVLKFLEEEYYVGPITGATYEANSKRRRGA
ncbi:hypothetical protein N5K27_28785 [Pigmentiphaga sp. GD03639]|uniref:hypothetical protein n=1 Tax=Pigmentiphaga sp. GD03639 TaxID=2975354 RepID=UPI002446DB51|nr:hypothetical protein [Pigmentiphaga sp. GD03639]MDH2240293.1 hypothetical protein [Pigmentiphaga sp. GD03639]